MSDDRFYQFATILVVGLLVLMMVGVMALGAFKNARRSNEIDFPSVEEKIIDQTDSNT